MSISRAWLSASTLLVVLAQAEGPHALISRARAQTSPVEPELEPGQPSAVAPGAGATPTAPPPCGAERFIELSTTEGLEPALFAEVRTDLASELAHRGIEVCGPGSTPREAAGVVVLSASDSTVVIELDDRVTHKRVGRDLTLAGLPANGRALAIAIAIDELLRASWAELDLNREGTPEEESQREDGTPYRTTRAINARGTPTTPMRVSLGGELGFQHTAERYDAFSLSARGSMHPWQRGWFTLSVGGLTTLPVSSTLGDVLASGVRAALTAGVCSKDQRRTFGCTGVRGELDYLALRGMAPETARGRVQHALVVQVAAVGMLGVALEDSRTLFGELSLGGVALGAEATDGTRVVVGATGLIFALHVGLEFGL
jgi:hypothetical protein